MTGNRLAVLIEERRTTVPDVVLAIDDAYCVVAPIHDIQTLLIGAWHGINGAFAQRNRRVGRIGGELNRSGHASGSRSRRSIAGHAGWIGEVLADCIFTLTLESRAADDGNWRRRHWNGESEGLGTGTEYVCDVAIEIGSPQSCRWRHQVDRLRRSRQRGVSHHLGLQRGGDFGGWARAPSLLLGLPCGAG